MICLYVPTYCNLYAGIDKADRLVQDCSVYILLNADPISGGGQWDVVDFDFLEWDGE